MNQNYHLIPDQAFLYFPKKQQILQHKNQKIHRIIFDGGLHYTETQIKKIKQLKQQIKKKQKNNNLENFTDNIFLRFLQANQFNNTNCIKALRQYKIWQQNNLPIKLNKEIQKLLKQGILYMSGRDYSYRPILVVNVGKILDISPKQQIFLNTLGYFFQYIIQNCLIEGQIQNWLTIIDLGNASVFSLGGTLIDTITYCSNNFRARVHHSYLLNAPSSIKWVWSMVKGALNEDQLRKLSLSGKKQLAQEDFLQINKSQIQIKYGGQRQDIKNFWPLSNSINNFETQKSKLYKLISIEEYNKKYYHKQLKNRKINLKFISQKLQNEENQIQQNSISSENQMQVTKSDVQQNLNELNLKIPKEKSPPQIPTIPQTNNFQTFINSLINKFFD